MAMMAMALGAGELPRRQRPASQPASRRARLPAFIFLAQPAGEHGEEQAERTTGRTGILPRGRFPWRKHWAGGSQHDDEDDDAGGRAGGGSHQQAGLAAGTVADDDELAAYLGHGWGGESARRAEQEKSDGLREEQQSGQSGRVEGEILGGREVN